MKFSIPYNGHNNFMKDMVNEYGSFIKEIYLAPNKMMTHTGRMNDAYNKQFNETPQEYENKITELMSFAYANNIKINMLFNGSFINLDYYTQEGFQKLYDYIDLNYRRRYLTGITIIDPYLVTQLKKIRDNEWPNLEIHASVNMYANDINRVKILEDLGMDSICIDRDINRDMEKLKKIRENTNTELKIMVNEGCLMGCPFRKNHHERKEVYTGNSELLLDIRKSLVKRFEKPITDKLAFCIEKYLEDTSQIFRSPFIRPEDLHYYDGIADTYKIAGREMDCERLGTIIKAYVTRNFKGNLWDLIFRFSGSIPFYINNAKIPPNFHETLSRCNGNCIDCGFCKQLQNLVEVEGEIKYPKWNYPDKEESLRQLESAYSNINQNNELSDWLPIVDKQMSKA